MKKNKVIQEINSKKAKKSIIITLSFVLLIATTLNENSTARYKAKFQPAVQTIVAAPWEVNSTVDYNGTSVNEQILSGFKPGDTKTNLIKFVNDNDYETTFLLEVITSEFEENNNLFLNENIDLLLKNNSENGIFKVEQLFWEESLNGENRIYKYEINIPSNTTVCYQMDIVWTPGENDFNFANKSGKISYKINAERTIISENIQ